jgi:hypothetical protein
MEQNWFQQIIPAVNLKIPPMFKRSLLYSLIAVSVFSGRAAYADPEIDDFERSALGSNWRVLAGGASTDIINNSDLGLIDNSARFGLVSWSATAFTADQFSEAVISPDKNVEMLTQVFVRWRQGDLARYAFHYAGDPRQEDVFGRWEIKYDGVPTPQTRTLAMSELVPPPAPGDTLRIEVAGFTIKGFHNGIEVIFATDTDASKISSGEPGVAYRWATDLVAGVYPAPVWESWTAGSLPAPPLIPDITVLDTSGSTSDLQLSFGNVNVGTSADSSMAIRNDGGADLVLPQVAASIPLAPPFSIQADNCSPGILMPNDSCSLVVRFSPSSVETFNDTFDIPSNDPDENPVTFSVSGTGIDAGAGAAASNGSSGGSSGSMSWLLVLLAAVTAYLRRFSRWARSSLS